MSVVLFFASLIASLLAFLSNPCALSKFLSLWQGVELILPCSTYYFLTCGAGVDILLCLLFSCPEAMVLIY